MLNDYIEKELKRVNDEWDKVFDAIGDLVFIQDKDFTITRVNKAFADALKLKPEKIIGRKCYEVLHQKDALWPCCPFVKTKEDEKFHIEEVNDGSGYRAWNWKRRLLKTFSEFPAIRFGKRKKAGGTGLGLAISKEIVTRHNGKIWVESEVGKGSVFHFLLPVKERRI
jgi:signal transduction histidine kinase